MLDELLAQKSVQILKALYYHSNKELTLEEIREEMAKELTYVIITNAEFKVITDNLRSNGHITETFTVANVLDLDSKAETKYKITSTGIRRYTQLSSQMESRAFAQIDFEREYDSKKKSNRRWLIGCAIGFVVLITVMIVVILASG